MTIGVFGTGRFGFFWAELLARHTNVVTYSRNQHRAAPAGCTPVSLDELGAADAVMLCVAISAVPDALSLLVPHLQSKTMLLDTCSVKVHPVKQMLSLASAETVVIGTHPMFGPDSARHGVSGLPIVLTPARNLSEHLELWNRFFTGMGLRVLIRSAEEHDREAASTQGITHLLGRVLAELDLEASSMGTVGYQKLLEVMEQTCNDPYQLFLDLQRFNPFTSEMRGRFRASLARVADALDADLDSAP